MGGEQRAELGTAFRPWSRAVRARRALRSVCTGASLGLALGAVAALGLHLARIGPGRPFAALAGVAGAAVGLAFARRRRWSDGDVALYLDARLGTPETLATAIDAAARGATDDASAHVVAEAVAALGGRDRRAARPRVLAPVHALAPTGALAIALVARLPVPPTPEAAATPGLERVTLAKVAGLDRIESLDRLDARDLEQKRRLESLSAEARRLRTALAAGAPKREAEAEIARLRDAIAAEKLSATTGRERAGLEAAVGRLAADERTRGLARALGDSDFQRVDDEAEKLADAREARDRELSKQALDEAAAAAEKAGSPAVAKALRAELEKLRRAEANAKALRELADALKDALPSDVARDRDEFERAPSPRSMARLVEGLDKTLAGLSPEERAKLADALKKRSAKRGGGGASETSRGLDELGRELATEEGRERLRQALRDMANPTSTDEAERQRALGGADRGGAEAEGEIAGRPVPLPAAGGEGSPGSGSDGTGGGATSAAGGRGSDHDRGRGEHVGKTDAIEGDGLVARARGRLGARAPLPDGPVAMGRAEARPGETAGVAPKGAAAPARADELGGVERSDVPEEYREQVGRYFHP